MLFFQLIIFHPINDSWLWQHIVISRAWRSQSTERHLQADFLRHVERPYRVVFLPPGSHYLIIKSDNKFFWILFCRIEMKTSETSSIQRKFFRILCMVAFLSVKFTPKVKVRLKSFLFETGYPFYQAISGTTFSFNPRWARIHRAGQQPGFNGILARITTLPYRILYWGFEKRIVHTSIFLSHLWPLSKVR